MSSDVRGTRSPAYAQAACARPEQSKHVGPFPPQQYGFPTCAAANATTARARSGAAGSRPVQARSTSAFRSSERPPAAHPDKTTAQSKTARTLRIFARGEATVKYSAPEMDDLLENPSFMIYCLATVALSLNMLGLWGYSGVVRTKSKTTPNAEDAARVQKGATVTGDTPPALSRVLRAHMNAAANIPPFLLLALLYVLLGATPKMAWILFGGFTAMRFLHSFFYLREIQPWRTIAFALGGFFTLGVLIQVTRAAVVRLLLLTG